MKLQIFSVYDKAVMAYLPPFFARSKGEALRSFSEACNDVKHQFNRHNGDYVLQFLGEFDDAGGIFNTVEPVRIVSALECLVEDVFSAAKEVVDENSAVDALKNRRLPM